MAHLQLSHTFSAPKQAVFEILASPVTVPQQFDGIMQVKWINSETQLRTGAEFLFEMTRFGVTQPVRIAVDKLVIGNSLTYRQITGTFRAFHHTIKFEASTPHTTVVTDLVDYEVPFGVLGQLANDLFVRSDLKKMLFRRLLNVEQMLSNNSKEPSIQA